MSRYVLSALTLACLIGAGAARAEPVTLVCEEDTPAVTWVVKLDEQAGTLALDNHPPVAASFTPEAIAFKIRREPRPNPPNGVIVGATLEGAINRLAGAMDMQHCMLDLSGPYVCRAVHARCRRATPKF